ncbi:hypothetical protein ACPF04_06245 [Campylobacter sp. MOP51]|uniref:hypothetical protein n=1 Tax=Campylobacter canis TaxID=3378588 RepID=UPI003C37C72A
MKTNLILSSLLIAGNLMAFEACGNHFDIDQQIDVSMLENWSDKSKYGVDTIQYTKELNGHKCTIFLDNDKKIKRIYKTLTTPNAAIFPQTIDGGLDFQKGYIEGFSADVDSKKKNKPYVFTSYLSFFDMLNKGSNGILRNQAEYATPDNSQIAYLSTKCETHGECLLSVNLVSGSYFNQNDLNSKLFRSKMLRELDLIDLSKYE